MPRGALCTGSVLIKLTVVLVLVLDLVFDLDLVLGVVLVRCLGIILFVFCICLLHMINSSVIILFDFRQMMAVLQYCRPL